MALIRLVFFGFFPIQFVLAGVLVWMAMTTEERGAELSAQYAALRAQEPPAVVDVGDWEESETARLPSELAVTGQLSLDNNTRLVKRTNGIKRDEALLYLLMDPDAGAGDKVVRAGIVLPPEKLDELVAYAIANATGFGPQGPVVTVQGLKDWPAQSGHARSAIKEQGLTVAPGFYFIEPFLGGREAALARLQATPPDTTWFYGMAAAFVLLGLFNMMRLVLRGRAPARRAGADPSLAPNLGPDIGFGASALPQAPQPARGRAGWGSAVKGPAVTWVSLVVVSMTALVFRDVSGPSSGGGVQMPGAVVMPFGLQELGDGLFNLILPMMLSLVVAVIVIVILVRRAFQTVGALGRAAGTVARPARRAVEAQPAPVSNLPDWAMVKHAEAPVPHVAAPSVAAAPAPALPPAIVSRRKDGAAIRPGFSLRGLLPTRKAPAKPALDPFERLAQQVRAERQQAEVRGGAQIAR
ncbi:MAG: hypothetical protein ACK4GO_12300 [Gemmobacter sp.]